MVFDPTAAPRDRAQFMLWYRCQTSWSEGHSYDDPAVSSPGLQAWFHEIRTSWPPLNGRYKSQSTDASTDYSIGEHVIYCALAAFTAGNAYPVMRDLAVKHRLGLYEVSEPNGEIMYPD
jgi:hypothetical protein